jgi:hypothetical protein
MPLEFRLPRVVAKAQREDFVVALKYGRRPPAIRCGFFDQDDLSNADTVPATWQPRSDRRGCPDLRPAYGVWWAGMMPSALCVRGQRRIQPFHQVSADVWNEAFTRGIEPALR